MGLFKKRCNHEWKVHLDVTKTYTGTGLANKGHKIQEREQILMCKHCPKIKRITI
jgi:hypothetical protein